MSHLPFLFHHDLVVATLGSGSRGNCTYVGDTRSGVLVDCGVSTRQVLQRLDAIGLGSARIDAVLVTHEHADHVGAARILDDKLFALRGARVPFFMSRGTRGALDERCVPQRVEIVQSGKAFRAGFFAVEPYTVPHDTRDPLAFLMSGHGVTAGVLTDLGRATKLVQQQVARMDVAVVEFNHDVQMLLDGSYPWSLKQRVRGPHGHLSNAQAAELVATAGIRLQHLLLAHLSDENNHPDVAREAAVAALTRAGLRRVEVSVASQIEPVGPVTTRAQVRIGNAAPVRPSRAPSRPRVPSRAHQLALFG
jgi:phosphoribosyl 1,2-cyclic phosphodiesterase